MPGCLWRWLCIDISKPIQAFSIRDIVNIYIQTTFIVLNGTHSGFKWNKLLQTS